MSEMIEAGLKAVESPEPRNSVNRVLIAFSAGQRQTSVDFWFQKVTKPHLSTDMIGTPATSNEVRNS
jgi:arabinogalactan endo-1,4-beta-galactosidase